MSEKTPQHSFENDDEHQSASFEADFDISDLVSDEEQMAIRSQVEQSYGSRDSVKTELVQSAREEVDAIYESAHAERKVLVDGKEETVIDSYTDARGNEWVELADGRQSMKHQEAIADDTQVPEIVSIESAPFPSQVTAEVSAPEAPQDALEAVEIHYKEVIAEKNFIKPEAATETEVVENTQIDEEVKEAPTVEAVAPEQKQPDEQKEQKNIAGELLLLQRQLRATKESFAHSQSRESGNLQGAMDELQTMKRRLQNVDGNRIDDILHGHIRQSVEQAELLTRQAARNEADKTAAIKKAEQVMSRTQILRGSSQNKTARRSHEGSTDKANMILARLRNTDPRYYRNQKGDFLAMVTSSLTQLEQMYQSNRGDTRVDQFDS